MTKTKKKLIHKDLRKFYNRPNETDVVFNTRLKDPSKERQKKFKKQRQKYGFDERETWNLDETTISWMYTHLKGYLRWGAKVVNIYEEQSRFYPMKRIVFKNDKPIYSINKREGYQTEVIFDLHPESMLSLGEVIDEILRYFEVFLEINAVGYCEELDFQLSITMERVANELAKRGIRLYAEILSHLWW